MPVASASSFRPAGPEEIRLPSQVGTDETVLVVSPNPADVIAEHGDVINVFSALAETGNGDEANTEAVKHLGVLLPVLRRVAVATLHTPRAVMDEVPEDDTVISVTWLQVQDLMYLFNHAMGGQMSGLAMFRKGQEPDSSTSSDSDDV